MIKWLPGNSFSATKGDNLSELILIAGTPETAKTHAVFIHGIAGHLRDTWRQKGTKDLWPRWLHEDSSDVCVWSIGYDAARTKWIGTSMHLPDRADNILPLLLAEPRMAKGSIAFVCHSLGGLILKAMLRSSESQSSSSQRHAIFLSRIRKVAFLGTPHLGAKLPIVMALLAPFTRPSNALSGLEKNDPNLRELNIWFREFLSRASMDVRVLVETRAQKFLGVRMPEWIGQIVDPSSSDPGTGIRPLAIDADHSELTHPAGKGSEVYIHVRSLVLAEDLPKPPGSGIEQLIASQTMSIYALADNVAAGTKGLNDKIDGIAANLALQPKSTDPSITDVEVRRLLLTIRKTRTLAGSEAPALSKQLIARLNNGDPAP